MIRSLGTPLLFVLLAGCGTGPVTYPVAGTVRFQNAPVVQGTIAFHHTDGSTPMARAELAADGSFVIGLPDRPAARGLPVGEYLVTVTSMTPGHGTEGDRDYRPPQPLIPLKYMRLTETPLRVTVEPPSTRADLVLSP